jgi:Flp pilus assembly pilin Flp
MNNPIMRFVKNTTAVESGFIAAGLTVSIAAVIGTLLYVFGI